MRSTRSIAGLWPRRRPGGKTVCALLLAALAGCASESRLLRLDPAFTAGALSRGGLAVLGVVQKDEVAQVRPPLIAALEAALRAERGDLRFVPAESVGRALGEAEHRRILNAYQASGSLDSTALRGPAVALAGAARYLVAGRVESDAVRSSSREIQRADSAHYTIEEVLRVTGRDARVVIRVYDLERRSLVWGAQYLGSAEVEVPGRVLAPQVGVPVGRGVQVGAGQQPPPIGENYPDPPPLARALDGAFRNFARELPK